MGKPSILIATNSGDARCFNSVVNHLSNKDCDIVVYEADKVANGTREFSAWLNATNDAQFTYNSRPFSPQEFDAAWYRRPNLFDYDADELRSASLADEYRTLQANIWSLVKPQAWLNSPQSIRNSDIKFPQLMAAKSVGLSIPESVISNSWQTVDSLREEKLIVKSVASGVLRSTTEPAKVIYTTVFKNKNLLPREVLPYPGIWQPFVHKSREWRITVVGDRIFSAAIYTKEKAKDDWRKHQFSPNLVSSKAEQFPAELQEKCLSMLRNLGLRFGALDFIESPSGEVVFLELNPNGQFTWLEQELGLPISKAISEELLAIAGQNRH